MKYFILLSLFTFAMISCKKSNTPTSLTPLAQFADSLYQVHIDEHMVAGGALLVYQNGAYLINQAYGKADIELDVPMPLNASFEIGSVTKQFTSAAVLMLAEEGKLSLDDDFTKYLPFDTGGRKVTIEQLLNHTSGIASYTEMPIFFQLATQQLQRDTLVRLVEEEGFLFEPGEAAIYNNSAFFMLGLIIEQVTEMEYADYLQEKIFDPLNMSDTYYCGTRDIVMNRAHGYDVGESGLMNKMIISHTWPYAAGSLCSTTADVFKWLQAIHNGKLLSEDNYQKLITPGTLSDGTPIRYAQGIVNYSEYGHRCIAHGGGIPGFLSETRYYPDNDLYIVSITNTAGPNGGPYFADAIVKRLLPKVAATTVDQDEDLTQLNGIYSGPVRGSYATLAVSIIDEGLTIQQKDKEEIDTFRVYLGDQQWLDDFDIISFRNGALHMDDVYNHYVLGRE